MFGFIGKAFKAVGGAIKNGVSKLVSGVANLFKSIVAKAKVFLIKAAQIAAIAGLTLVTGGLGLPIILSLAASGFVGGFAGGLVSSLLSGQKPRWGSLLKQAGLAAALTVTTFAVANYVAPYVQSSTTRALQDLPGGLADDAGRAAADAVFATSNRAVTNVFSGRPVGQGLAGAAGRSAFQTGVLAPARQATNDAIQRARDAVGA
ncbi:MAG: hypothetical protein ACAI25_18140, partial [Planctomycetota bacterium]